ncbi:MAG TPA: hypothetical protein VG247_20940 [Pseudonocardiaceae bacterium]|jgi:hypothetical protein|nr:hypothetical protein [Pseudonocardiaceae bacterium]
MTEIHLGRLGRITAGPEEGRYLEVVDSGKSGLLIYTYADEHRSPEVFDVWVPDRAALSEVFTETGWEIDWLPE